MTSPPLFHGGIPGLMPGDKLLPPSVTGTSTLLEIAQDIAPEGPQRSDRVYLTTEVAAAMFFAAAYPYGAVYLAVADGELEADPDCTEPGVSYQCASATVVAVIIPEVDTPAIMQAAFGSEAS